MESKNCSLDNTQEAGDYKDIKNNFYSNNFLNDDLDSRFYKGS
jgi:hypothetical protein